MLLSVFPFSVNVTGTSDCSEVFLSKLDVVGLIVLLFTVLSLTVITSICELPALKLNVNVTSPVAKVAKYVLLIVTAAPDVV